VPGSFKEENRVAVGARYRTGGGGDHAGHAQVVRLGVRDDPDKGSHLSAGEKK
jgi:hypothetical protein